MLGASIARALAERGDTVTVMQRSESRLGLCEIRGDITDAASVAEAVRDQDAVVHLSARVGVVGSESDFERVNVQGTRRLLDAMEAHDVRRLVHMSSPSVAHAGHALIGVAAEPADPSTARGPYARSKAQAELLVLNSAVPELAVLRPHLVWGPGDQQLVGRIVDRARRGRLALIGTGLALIDSTFTTNAVDATIAALDRADRLPREPLVVTNGEPRTVAELLARIATAAGLAPPRRHIPAAAARAGGAGAELIWARSRSESDPPMTRFLAEQLSTAHWFDQRRTRDLLDWTPRVSLDEGFAELHRWFAATG